MTAATIPQAQDTRRITESDADYQQMHRLRVRQLTRSVRRLIFDLNHGVPAQDAANAFARRHTNILKLAYLVAHREGVKDYYGAVSRTPGKWAARVQPSERVMTKRLLFYAAGSVLKMANEAVQAWHTEQMAKSNHKLSETPTQLAEPATPLQQTFIGLQGRIALQGEITWSGLNDGYVDAGEIDPANPATVLFWDLGPVKTQHCSQCPPIAAGSPYDRPGTPGGNELDATPGDGHTECGAACHCSLRYGLAPTAQQAQSVWQDAKAVPPPPPGSLHWPDVPRPTAAEVDAAQQKLLDDYRTQFDRWEAVRGDLPALPDLFGTEGVAGGWVTWEQLTPAQQSVLADVFSVLAQADATFGYPSLEESTAAYQAAIADLDAFIAKVTARAEHLDQFIQDLRAARQQDWEEMFGKGPIATYFWNLRQDWYDTLEWFISRTEPNQRQMSESERGQLFYNPYPRGPHGHWGEGGEHGRGESGGGGGVHAPHGMAAVHGQHAHGGQGSAGSGGELRQRIAEAEARIQQTHQRIAEVEAQGQRLQIERETTHQHYQALAAAHGINWTPEVWDALHASEVARNNHIASLQERIDLHTHLGTQQTYLAQLHSVGFGHGLVQYKDAADRNAVRAVFGHDIPDVEMAALFGAKAGDVLEISFGGPSSFHVQVRGPHVQGSHSVFRDAAGVGIHTNLVRNDLEARSAESGREIVRSLVRMRDMGIGRIETQAARGLGFNGYDTWAKLGFTGDIPHGVLHSAQADFGSHITRVEQLMRQPGGARWWRENGDTWDATFDFTPGSYSRVKLDALAARLSQEEPPQ